jgi:hypothetical protein
MRLPNAFRGGLIVLVALAPGVGAQPTFTTDNRLPNDCIELKHDENPVSDPPWQLPKPGDPLYDAAKEAQIRQENEAGVKGKPHLVRVFERGVFKGYATLSSTPLDERPAKEMNDTFIQNSTLPADAVQLADSAEPVKGDYFAKRPKSRPANVPADCIAVRVFHRGKVIGWTFMPKQSVEMLHQAK